MSDCTYKFTGANGKERVITGQAEMKAFLVEGGLDLFYPDGKYPWLKTASAVSSVLADERAAIDAINEEVRPGEVSKLAPVRPGDAGAGVVTAYENGQQLAVGDLLAYFDKVVAGSEKGEKIVNPKFQIGEVDESTAKEIAKYIDGYNGQQRRLRVSGRTLKHIHESRPAISREIVEQLPGMFTKPDEVLPDHRHVNKRALLIKERKAEEGQSKPKSYVATVEVEIEVEVRDGFIDIVTIMTAPDRSLKEARDLKKNWPEGQQRTERAVNSPHPLTPKKEANPEADFPDARPVGKSLTEPASAVQPESTKLTPAEARPLMEWQDLGQKDGVNTQILTLYESRADKDAKRGRMTVATITNGDRSSDKWMVEGDDQAFTYLAAAKKRAEELGMAKAVKDGYVTTGRAVVDTSRDKQVAIDINGQPVFMGTDGPLKDVPYTMDNGRPRTGVSIDRWLDETAAPAQTSTAAPKPADDKPRLTDAGEELTRNRRNRVSGISWADVEGMNDTLKVKTVTKANIWQKPNYEKLVEDGAPRWKVAILKAIYDKLAAKPDASRALTDDQMKRYIETMGKVRDAAMAELDRVESSAAVKAAFESDEVKSFAAKGDDMVQAAAIMGLRGVLDGNRIMDTVFPKPEGAKLGRFDRTTEQGKDNNTNALLIGGNNALQAMQFNYKAVSKARDLLMEGFPAKQEAWSKSYNITPKDGRFFVIKKGYTFRRADNHPTEGFETQEQAQEFAREITKRGADKPLPPSRGLDLDSAIRTGPDWRQGKDVTSDEVKDAFGLRGVNLGEYVKANQKIAQLHLNNAYDGLMDLADLMGVPPKAISLNGTLGLAIGAQGSGRALAHFVPGVNEINITRDSGAGALAHEWAHALDHYFGVQQSVRIAKSEEPFLTEHLSGKPDGVRPEVFEAFKAMVEAMKRKTMTQDEAREWLKGERVKAERALKFTIENMKAADQAAFDELSTKLMAGDVGDAGPDGVPGNIAGFLAAAKGDITQKARLTMAAERVNALRDEVRFLNTHRPQARTNYAKASGALDADKTKAYWSTNLEMFARAFESYVMDAMAERQRESLYLSGLSESPSWQEWEKKTGQLSPFPKAEERLAINQAAQALVNAIEARETDKGVAMFSRRSASGNRLPDAIIGHKLGDLNNHPDYAAAKAGDDEAALRIALDMVDDALVQKVRQAAGNADVIVPVVSVEESGRNKIPLMVAEVLADRLGSTTESQITQANSPKRTAMDGLSRLLNPPVFDGPVQAGAAYVLVDDTLTQGGTFAALASHINDGGGKVAAALALTGKQYSAKLSPSPELLSKVRERFQSVEDQFRAATGYGFDALTESEARYLAKHDDAESVRARIIEAGGQAIIGVGARNLSLSKGRRPGLTGLSSAEVQSISNTIAKRWANAPEIVVAADMSDPAIPQEVRDYDAKQRSLGAQGEPEGFWYGGKVYLMAGALRTPGDAIRVLLHESLGHYGLRGVFGGRMEAVLKQIAALRRTDVEDMADRYGLDMNDEDQRLQAAEEVLAFMAQENPRLGFVKRAIGAIRTWLRNNIPMLADMELTDAEIIRNFIMPARAYVQRGSQAGREMAAATASSRGQDQTQTEAFKRWYSGDYGSTPDASPRNGATGSAIQGASGEANGGVVGRGDDVRPAVLGREGVGQTARISVDGGQIIFDGASGPTDPSGKPVVFYHGTKADITTFNTDHPNKKDNGWLGRGVYVASNSDAAELYAVQKRDGESESVMPVYVAVMNPYVFSDAERSRYKNATPIGVQRLTERLKAQGYDGVVYDHGGDKGIELVAFRPEQVKSAIGNNGDFDPANPDIRFSRAMPPQDNDPEQVMAAAGSTASGFSGLTNKAVDALNDHFGGYPGKLSWWHKTVGSMYNLAERSPMFKRVFDAAQNFINDVSYYGTEAANQAPKILPKLETFRDLAKTPISAEDNKALASPIFEGTLSWARDGAGNPIQVSELESRYASLTAEQKGQMLLRKGLVHEESLKAWKASPLDIFDAAVENRFRQEFLTPGIVWTPAELKSIFGLSGERQEDGSYDGQIGLYQEFRAATDLSLDNMAKADMLRYGGKDVDWLKDAVMAAPSLDAAAEILRSTFMDLSKGDPDRSDELVDFANGIVDRTEKVNKLKQQGYAPLSRFGQYSVDVVVDGERQYFSLFESEREAKKMAAAMIKQYGAESVSQGTMSEEEFKLFQGITPETLELFGNALGLGSTGNEAQDQVFQAYLKLTKNNRSAMKRLMHRKGVAGYSEDVGRVLAAFVYSNARQTSAALHIGELGESVDAIPKGQGQLKDAAVQLAQYIKEPREEAHHLRGFLFAQYLGGSIASAMVNFTQPLTISIPYLSQFGGLGKAMKAWSKAMKDMSAGAELEPGLAQALKVAEEQGVVSPQEVHQLMAQARGMGTLNSGDGTKIGDARAIAGNNLAKLALGWGKLFGFAEQINRRSTFIAAYRLAIENQASNPSAFAAKAVDETQFINNKANKMRWGRGPIGATLMTFKSYSINWLELVHRLATQNGTEGKWAAAYMVGALLLMAGAGGLPFADDIDDVIDGLAQRLGYNLSTKKAKQEFLEDIFGKAGAGFISHGITGIPGAPVDIAGRMGMGNLIPGTGLFMEKRDYTRDAMEIAGPAGDFITRVGQGLNDLSHGNPIEAALAVAPKAVSNAVKGADMLDTGMYRDTRGRKVIDTSTSEAISKLIGFQPASVSNVQEAAYLGQRAKDFYALRKQEISAQWANGIFEKDPEQIAKAREAFRKWNASNPGQRMAPDMPGIARRVREMRKGKLERIADTSPKGMREMLRQDFSGVQ